jgi:tryptophan synthase beta chain
MWRPSPLYRAHALEQELDTPAEIYFKYEGASPSGSHKLNSALAQVHYAKQEGVRRLVTDTGAGQWGVALALAGALMGIEVVVYMVRASFHHKPGRRHLMETFGATVLPSPGPSTSVGRSFLAEDPDHPGSEATAVSEALEVVGSDPEARFAMGAFANHVLLHQTVIGLEAREQLELVDREPDYLIASVGCGSNMGGLALPWVADKLNGRDITILAAEPTACPTLTRGEYRWDFADATGSGPMTRTYTLGHEFVPPPIHAGGLRYHGAAPLVGLLRDEGLIEANAYGQNEVFAAGALFARLTGFLPAPETAHAIRGVIDVARECRERRRKATILFNYSGHGLLDLGAYDKFNAGELRDVETLAESVDTAASEIAVGA